MNSMPTYTLRSEKEQFILKNWITILKYGTEQG
jgi:hypothetical protein